jgi:hypothetical protein
MGRPPYSARTLAYARSRLADNMLGAIQVLRRAVPTLDSTSLVLTTTVATTVYDGKARIYSSNGGAPIFVGEGIIAVTATTVSLPHDAPEIKVDDIVLVTSFGADVQLQDDTYTVKDVAGGGLMRATRQLSCQAYQANRWWE